MELPPFWTDLETEIARLAKLIEEQATVKKETKMVMKEVTQMFAKIQQGEAPCCCSHKEVDPLQKAAAENMRARAKKAADFRDLIKRASLGDGRAPLMSMDWPVEAYTNTNRDIRTCVRANGACSVVIINPKDLKDDINFKKLLYHAPEFRRFNAEEIEMKGANGRKRGG